MSYDEYISSQKKSAENMLLKRIIASMLGSPKVFDLNLAAIGKKMLEEEKKEENCQHYSYPIIASSCHKSENLL